MHEPELFFLFVRPMNRAGIRYVIGGSVAATFYGEPRLTYDVDFIIFLNAQDIIKIMEIFPASVFYTPPPEAIITEIARKKNGHFNVIHNQTGFKADMYLTGQDEMNAWAFRDKRRIEFENETINVAPPEYVIVRKLEYYREGRAEKHLRDIRAILAVQGKQLNHATLQEWVRQRGLEAEWQLASTL